MVATLAISLVRRQGNVGTAAYLDVFGSIYAVMKELQSPGRPGRPLPMAFVVALEGKNDVPDMMCFSEVGYPIFFREI